MPTPHPKHICASIFAVVLLAVTSFAVWTHQAQADHVAPHPDFSFLSTDLSQAALDHDLHSLDPAALALAERMDPVRHARTAGRPEGWAMFDLDKVPSLNFHNASFTDARKINALIPAAPVVNPPAQPFVLQASTADRAQAAHCLTQAVYYEAGNQGPDGKAAVAQTVLNRLRHPDYPKSVCGVVFQGSALKTGCQFSFTCDGSLNQPIMPAVWKESEGVAQRALNGYVMPTVGEATHYHANYVQPYWAPSLVKIAQVGEQIFYRWTGPWGEPAAFTGRYAGHEAHLTPAVLTEGDSRVARPGAIPNVRGVVGHVRTFTIADNSAPGGVRTRVSGVFNVAPTAVVAASATKAAEPAVAVVPPAPVAAPAPSVAIRAPAPMIAATS